MTKNQEQPDSQQAEQAARKAREAQEERAESQPFSYPYPERRANVRATRHITAEEADADAVPGVPGGYGSTGGGQPGGSAGINPDGEGTLDPAAYADTIGGGDVRADTDQD
ncbi:hypothetical protein [Streptomyces sp. NPDC054842]